MFHKLKRYVALKIKVDFETGYRAGNIDPNDPNLYALAQDLEDGWEIRLVLDDRDVSVYEGIEGVEVIEGIENIDRAIEEMFPDEDAYYYGLFNEEIFRASIIAKHQDPNDSFTVDDIPDAEDEIEFRDDGVYVKGVKVASQRVSQKYRKIHPAGRVKFKDYVGHGKDKDFLLEYLKSKGVKGIVKRRKYMTLSERLQKWKVQSHDGSV